MRRGVAPGAGVAFAAAFGDNRGVGRNDDKQSSPRLAARQKG